MICFSYLYISSVFLFFFFFFSSRRRHTRCSRDWSSDVCSSDLTTLTPRTAGVLLALGQRGIQHAVFANYDDHPSRLREVLGQEEARSSSRQLLDQLGDALAPLPSELRWVLEEALRSPGEVQTEIGRAHV